MRGEGRRLRDKGKKPKDSARLMLKQRDKD